MTQIPVQTDDQQSASVSDQSSSTTSTSVLDNLDNIVVDDITYDDLLNKDILELMGYQNLTDQEKQEHYSRMLETIQNRVICRVDDLISPEDQEEWMNTVKSKTDQEKMDYLKSKNIHVDKIMAEESLLYKAEIVRAARNIMKSTND